MYALPTIDMKATGKKINNLRVSAGMTVKDVTDIFAFATPNAVYKWCRGDSLPTIDNLVVLATVFHVHIDDILVTR